MIEVNCINCGRPQRKRKRDDNGFNFCCEECKIEAGFKKGYWAKNIYFIIKNLAFVLTKNKQGNISGWFVIDKFNLWVLNLGSWSFSNEYISNSKVGKLHILLNNTDISKGEETDHKNRIKRWNTLNNLRISDRSLNNQNKNLREDNRSGVTGVTYSERYNHWISNISYKKESIKLGVFDNPKDAILARIEGENKYWGYKMTKYDDTIDYLDVFLSAKSNNRGQKEFIGVSPNGKKFLYNNQKEFSDLFDLSKKMVNLTLRKKQNTHKGWKFLYKYEFTNENYIDLINFSYCIGLNFGKNYTTKNCGNVKILPKFNENKEVAVIFLNDENKVEYYFSKSDIINGNCYRPKFVCVKNGNIGQVYARKDSPYYKLWLEFLDKDVQYEWIKNFKSFKENIKLLNSFNRDDLFKDTIYFDFKDFVFRYKNTNEIRKKLKDSSQFDFIGIFENIVYLFNNQNDVAKLYNLDTGAISRCISGKYKQTKGWQFIKKENYNDLNEFIDKRI